MNYKRLEQLFEFLEKDPNDPFLLYAIATEYNTTSPNRAKIYFDKLLSEHQDYVATYYHAAKLYASMGLLENAESIYRKGIDIASQKGEQLALRELKNAYDEFLFENE